ncbi:MAG: metal ABC transporter permease [Acidobacteriota bacterium]
MGRAAARRREPRAQGAVDERRDAPPQPRARDLSLFKELKLSTFDSALSAALGFSPVVLHYALMTAVSITVVGAFESVGAILVVAMLIVPPATAYLLTDRLEMMLALATGFGALSAILGYAGARWLDASIAGAMATAAGLLFGLVFIVSPQHGLLAKRLRRRRVLESVAGRMVLLHLGRDSESTSLDLLGQRFSWRPRRLGRLVDDLEHRGWVSRDGAKVQLTAAGEQEIERSGHLPLRHGV